MVVANFVVKTVPGKTDSCHRLQGPCFFLSLHVPRIYLFNSVSVYVLFLRVSRRGSLCLSKLSRVLFASIKILLRELEHDMDEPTTRNSRPEVGEWLHKGFRSRGKPAARAPVEAKCEHGGHNVSVALQNELSNCSLSIVYVTI